MSELPWENKKIAEIMSSVVDEVEMSPDVSEKKKSSTPQIPDILASAFADIPMEEAKIEVHEPISDVGAGLIPEASTPFGDLPDLSALGQIKSEGTKLNLENISLPSALPPFMNTPNISGISDEKENIASDISKSLFNPELSGMNTDHSVATAANSRDFDNKRSPPPLFELFTPENTSTEHLEGLETSVPNLQESEQNAPPSFPSLVPSDGNLAVPDQFATALANGANPAVASNPFDPTPVVNSPPFAGSPTAVSNPFEPTPVVNSPPFGGSPAAVSNPFEPTPATDSPPLGGSPSVVSNPFDPSPVAESPPFGGSPAAVSNPFDGGHVASVNPFEPTSIVEASPFGGSPIIGANPFGEHLHSNEQFSPNDNSGMKGSTKSPVNVAAFKKNIEEISVVARGFIKNLTKGKSLIERMEDMKGDTTSDESYYNGPDDPSSPQSPFENESVSSVNPFISSPATSFSSPAEPLKKATDNAQVNPFEVEVGRAPVENIRKITPIDDPIMEMDDKYSIDEVVSSDNVLGTVPADDPGFLGVDSELVKFTPVVDFVVSGVDNDVGNDVFPDSVILPDSNPEMVIADEIVRHQDEPVLSIEKLVSHIEPNVPSFGIESQPEVFSVEPNGMKVADERYGEIENDINILKDNIGDMGLQVSSIRAEVETFSSKFSGMDMTLSSLVKANEEILSQDNGKVGELESNIGIVAQKLSDFESTLVAIESGNSSVSSDLSRMEDDISGLVNSYTALLAQLHESLQENESKFSRIDEVSGKLDTIASSITSMEKSSDDAKSTSMEFSRSISSLIDNMGNISSEFQEFRQKSEQKNAAMLEKINSTTEYVESELKKLGARSYKGFGQNVHLSNIIKNSGNMKLCMEWLEFLMELVGRNNLPDILSYYEELGWITEKVRMELLHYADGIDFYMEKPDWKLTPDDHVKSIWFIESLAGMKVDKNRLSVIERDIEKVKKGSEIYGI
ncbi:FlaD/FlaE family flagellar protein [Methanolobus sp. ZRKC5]|uniref:FlaD/FlaE family flagellar protein n=1 Tax=unclassified Methanolobus TaxID=2629569 RepID=UPI00313A7D35